MKKELTPQDLKFIQDNHRTSTVREMAKEVGHNTISIYRYMSDNGLPVFAKKKRKVHAQSIFFNVDSITCWVTG